MKKHCSFLSFLSCFLLLFTACRRDWDTTPLPAPTTLSFFDLPVGSFPIVQQLAQSLQQQELRQPFARELMLKTGNPAWNRALVLGGNTGARGSADTTMVFIPLLPADSSRVGGALAAAILGSDTLYKIIYAGDYAQYGFTANGTMPDAQAVALLLMQLEYQVLGHKIFILSDERLFGGSEAAKGRLLALHPAGEGCANCALASGPVHAPCFNYDMWNGSGGSASSGTYAYGAEGCYNFIPTPGGSGNWNAGWTTNVPQTGGGPGWNNTGWAAAPMAGYQNLLTSDVSTADQQAINGWKLNNIRDSLDSCRSIILRKLLSGNNELGRILVKMDRSINDANNIEKFEMTYVTEPLVAANSNDILLAKSERYRYENGVFKARIVVNQNYLDSATDLAIAQAIIHETIHAYMKSILFRRANHTGLAQLQQMTYSAAFDQYVDSVAMLNPNQLYDYLSSPDSTPVTQIREHNYMANKLLRLMSLALQDYDDNRLGQLLGTELAKEYYWRQSWQGLYRTRAWVSHWPNFWNGSVVSPPTYPGPALHNDDLQEFDYALTYNRLMNIYTSIHYEITGSSLSLGRRPVTNGCYQ